MTAPVTSSQFGNPSQGRVFRVEATDGAARAGVLRTRHGEIRTPGFMPVGTKVTAARGGVVADVRMKFRDGQQGEHESNWVKIRHPDGTFAHYGHLTERGALVDVGDHVAAGQPIGLSGNTGNTGGKPHLHFHVSPCSEPIRCGTLPVTFRNTDAHPDGLDAHRFYHALPYGKSGA